MSLNKETQSNQILSHEQSLAEIVLCVKTGDEYQPMGIPTD